MTVFTAKVAPPDSDGLLASALLYLLVSVIGSVYPYRQNSSPRPTNDIGRSQFSAHYPQRPYALAWLTFTVRRLRL